MEVNVTFDGIGLELILSANTDAEKAMLGAVLDPCVEEGYPQSPRSEKMLVAARISYEGHYGNKKISFLRFRVPGALNAVLDEIDRYLEGRQDTRDGGDGKPLPNDAMELLHDLRAARGLGD